MKPSAIQEIKELLGRIPLEDLEFEAARMDQLKERSAPLCLIHRDGILLGLQQRESLKSQILDLLEKYDEHGA